MFRDGRRKIDMMLCYEEDDQGVMTEEDALKRHQRKLFHENLVREGLEIEVEDKAQAFDGKTYFVKIHIPWRTESRYAEVMNLKLPVKRFITISVKVSLLALKELLHLIEYCPRYLPGGGNSAAPAAKQNPRILEPACVDD